MYPDGTVKGHDHLTGVDSKGHVHATRHVYLVPFTDQSVADGAINSEITTLDALHSAMTHGDVLEPIDTGLIVHASVVSAATYAH